MINTRTQNMLIAIDIDINKWLRNRKIRDGGARKTQYIRWGNVVRFVTFLHLPFSLRSLDLSLQSIN